MNPFGLMPHCGTGGNLMRQIHTILLSLILLTACGSGVPEAVPATLSTPSALSVPLIPSAPSSSLHTIKGRAITLDGSPVSGASIFTSDGETTTDNDGWFQVPARRVSQWVTVRHPNFLPRTRAAAPDSPVLVRLTPNDGETISIHFVGDTMFGRRFYDPNEDGDTSDGLLQIGDGVSEHLALLSHVKPLLENADLTVVNLESPLTTVPYFDPTKPRPVRFHPTKPKPYVFASHLSAATALRKAGVDVVDLANNHLYDMLDKGITDTLNALEQAGFQPSAGYLGAGLSEKEAWAPAVFTVRGQSIAFLGCTSITGRKRAISYVASDANNKGGAAKCDEEAVYTSVADAHARHDVVIFMIHGGYEYDRSPSAFVRRMTTAAREAGATLVINHHPHVVGGFDWNGSSLVAWTLGNFLFDQKLWPTFESYLLAVHLRRGEVVRVYVEPLMIEGYLPKGLTGGLADFVARGAAGRELGPFIIEDGAMEIDIDGLAARHDVARPLNGGSGAGTIFHLDEGRWVSGFSGAGDIRLGRDLLWVGSFEDEDVDAQYQEGALWDLEGPDKRIGTEYAYEGDVGARIQRSSGNKSDIVLTPLHRILVEPSTKLSVVGMACTGRNANLSLQLSWYPDTRGASDTQTIEPIVVKSDDAWEPFRVDVTVPSNAVAIGLFLRLKPPLNGLATVDLDNIRVIEWAPVGSPFSPLYDHIWVVGTGEATLSKDFLPGAELWAAP